MILEKTYQPHELEKKWYQVWEQAGYFQPEKSDKAYCIMLPPPNVTGTLHMGHAFQDTLMDTQIRYHRMRGYQTLWQGGTDHAGIATQMVVERQLEQQGTSRKALGRDVFVQKVWEWKAQSGDMISQQMRRLGTSIDWTRERFTMDEGLSHAVKEVFVRLFDEGLIYRGQRLVNWDPKLHTAVSDLEVNSEEEDGFLWYIRYPVTGTNEHLIVATTRPETMLGDAAVAVHPSDPRYQHLIGQTVQLPLCDRAIPIISDEFVDPEFGTGCVKITPAHDFNDYEVGKRHNLPMINIFDENAVLNQNAPIAYRGLSRFDARHQIVRDLEKLDLMEKIEPHTLKVPRGERSGEIMEPFLTHQWFLKTESLALEAINAVTSGKIEFVPENWSKTYFEWMNNIQDWCISRQLWWGHQIPAWSDAKGQYYAGFDEANVREKYKLGADVVLTQETDVLDTWFSSALWPFSTLGWPEKTPELATFYPTNLLVTGFDIIFFWVARMIMMGLKFTGEIPFKQVLIHGIIQDHNGQKMSKSKGNIIDPIDLIDGIDLESLVAKRTAGLLQPAMAKQIERDTRKQFPDGIPSFGTDALRFTFCEIASPSRHIRFDMARVESNRFFCNKIWNATRFVLMNIEGIDLSAPDIERTYSLADKWIWTVWQNTKQLIHEHLATYRFDLLAHVIYDFVWNTYCDWYVELSKPTLMQPNVSESYRNGARFTLVAILEEVMRAMHPIMPFITEEIWQILSPILGKEYFTKATLSIMVQPYPEVDEDKLDLDALTQMELLQAFIMGIRTVRGEMNVNPQQQVSAIYRCSNETTSQVIENQRQSILTLAKLKELNWIEDNAPAPISATQVVGDIEIFIPLAGLIDQGAEAKRLTKEIEKLHKEIEGCQRKLADEKYINKAPAQVVEKERERLQTAENSLKKLNENLQKISTL
jgi:valyl-tRNA synthetase